MKRRMKSGKRRLYSRKADPRAGRRRGLGAFANEAGALRREREVRCFKRMD